ncbi:MAG: N-acetylmuramoyl-L-alanine amidase [Eubacteriales bacterium]|nr:N-acetylmuramoyl-L-alanine amidase [Eubacteriales bacterium]
MPPVVVIDAGHGGGQDSGAVYQGREEKNDNLSLALAVGEILQRNGVDVIYTRTEDVYQQPFEKAQIANNAGADFFVSIHRNSGAVPGQYSGVQTLVYDKSGVKLQMAENINSELEKLGFRNLGVEERPGLVVLRRTQMPAVLVEAGFINSEEDNRIFDEKFQEVAQAIADGILETIREENSRGQEEETPSGQMVYSVQTGAFRNRRYAWEMLFELVSQGFPAYLTEEDGYFRVRVGFCPQMDCAVEMERVLRRYGYNTWIVTVDY